MKTIILSAYLAGIVYYTIDGTVKAASEHNVWQLIGCLIGLTIWPIWVFIGLILGIIDFIKDEA